MTHLPEDFLAEEGVVSITQLAARPGVAMVTMTPMLRKLEFLNLV